MKLFIPIFGALISLHFASTAEMKESQNERQNRKRREPNPVSTLFNQVGALILDLDATFAAQTEPKVEYENNVMVQLLEPLEVRREYFDRVQENYRAIQNRLGSIIEDAISPKQDGTGRSMDPLASTLLPNRNYATDNIPKGESPLHSRLSNSQGDDSSVLYMEEMKENIERIRSDARKAGEFLTHLGRPSNKMSSVLVRRKGDVADSAEESNPQGRIIGDALFSESRFDQYIRQLLRDHGRWVLDNPFMRNWRNSRQLPNQDVEEEVTAVPLSETTEEIITSTTDSTAETETIPTSSESGNELPQFEESFESRLQPVPFMAANYYQFDDGGRVENEKVDILIKSDPEIAEKLESESEENAVEVDQEIEKEVEELEPQESVILAFTHDGVPLKLRMGPEIDNPLKYLHRVLRTAGVTLKVPVESYEELEPVGDEVLLLGSSSGIFTKAVRLDLSNPNELESLLRTLRFKISGEN